MNVSALIEKMLGYQVDPLWTGDIKAKHVKQFFSLSQNQLRFVYTVLSVCVPFCLFDEHTGMWDPSIQEKGTGTLLKYKWRFSSKRRKANRTYANRLTLYELSQKVAQIEPAFWNQNRTIHEINERVGVRDDRRIYEIMHVLSAFGLMIRSKHSYRAPLSLPVTFTEAFAETLRNRPLELSDLSSSLDSFN